MCRSQEYLNQNDLLEPVTALESEDDDSNRMQSQMSVTQEFKNFETEKELVENAVQQIKADQTQNNEKLREQSTQLADQMQAKVAEVEGLKAQLVAIQEKNQVEKQMILQQMEEMQKVSVDQSKKEKQLLQQIDSLDQQLAQEQELK